MSKPSSTTPPPPQRSNHDAHRPRPRPTVTFAHGSDNIGVYVPVFATAGADGMSVYVVVFLLLVAVWVAAGRYFATRPAIAKALSRRGYILLPVALIGIGLPTPIEGGAFGL
ncbi:cadmium resistance transporter [Spirillospora sp. NPDC050679]